MTAQTSIDSALQAVEAAVERVTLETRHEQSAQADVLPAVVAAKVDALEQLNQAWIELRRALAADGFGGSLHALKTHGASAALRTRAAQLLDAIGEAQAANAVSQKLIHSKLAYSRTVAAALQAQRDDALVAPNLHASRFANGATAATRSLGRA